MKKRGLLTRSAAVLLSGAMAVMNFSVPGLADDSSSDVSEEKTDSSDSDPQPLSNDDIQEAQDLIGMVQKKEQLKGDQNFNGMTYHEIFSDDDTQNMESIDSRDLFKKVLTKSIPGGGNEVSDIWGPAAVAALLSGGYNNFYYVDDYWNPDTFAKAFINWDTTWCWYESTTEGSVLDYFKNADNLQYTRNFANVANDMVDSIKNNSEYVHSGLSDGYSTYDSIADDFVSPDKDYDGDIFYSIYSKVIHRGASGEKTAGHLGYAWDSFALCFYDFKVNPLYDALAAGEDDSENVYYETLTEENKTSTFATNDSAENITINKTRSESTTSTTSNTVSASKTLSYTESGGFTYTHQIGKPPYATSWSVSINFSATQSNTSTESNTTGESSTHTDTFTVSGIAKPGTQLCLNQSNATSRGAVSYSCPVAYQYKVAVLSICGDYSGALPNRHVNVKHSGVARIFGKDNGDALADLKDKYDNPSYDNFGLDWSEGAPVRTHLDDHRFYSSIGGTMTFVIKNYLSSITPLTPLHALNRTGTDKSKSTYTIIMSEDRPSENRVNLGTVDVTGSSLLGDGSLIPYYGFDKSKGSWKLCDENGELLTDSEYAEIQNTVAGSFLVAKKASAEPVYLMYYINDDTYPAFPGNPDKADVFMKNSDLSANAVIEVYIYDASNGEGFFGEEESEPQGDASPFGWLILLAAAALAVTALSRKRCS